jgi:hypothetical protein
MSLTAEFLHSTHHLRQVESEIPGTDPALRDPAYPTLENVLAKFMPLPKDGLFLGVASDGLPVLLNLSDPRPGALLLLGDSQTGKTDFLQGVACAASTTHSPNHLRFAVVTTHRQEWEEWESTPHCLGVWEASDTSLRDLLFDLSERVQLSGSHETLLLLVDDLQSLANLDSETQENLHWLLANGSSGRVWTIATLNADQASGLHLWVRDFGTRIYGRIADPVLADRLTPMPGANLRTLFSGAQFCIREKSHWLRFWLPLSKQEEK